MFSRFERMIAFRFLRSRRKEGFISVITGFSFVGIALGVATLIVVMAVMNGFRAEITNRILGINAHISLSSPSGEPITDFEQIVSTIEQLDGIRFAAPMVQGQVLGTANDTHSGIYVQGLSKADLNKKSLLVDNMVAGKVDDLTDESILIGSRLAQKLRVLPGDTVQFISPDSNDTFLGNIPRIKDYTVAGIFEVGMSEYDSSIAYTTLSAAQLYFSMHHVNGVNTIDIEIDNPNQVELFHPIIKNAIDTPLFIRDWKQANSHYFQSLKVERNVMFLILSLIICIAAFNIIAGLVMLVTDKQKEIAILRTMGATKGSIMRSFVLAGSVIGFVGTLLGFALGLSFALNIESIRQWLEQLLGTELFAAEIYFLSQLPADVQADDVTNVIVMALSLSFLATLYPAWKAASIEPVEALSHE